MKQKKAKLIKEYCRQSADNVKGVKKHYKSLSAKQKELWSRQARDYIEA